tara:strand:- start:80 stop:316 length:237 start_codon:yes stop_codon:yes gene_type:complete
MKRTRVNYTRTRVNYTLIATKHGEAKSVVFTGSAFMPKDRLCGDSAAIEELIEREKLPINIWDYSIEDKKWELEEVKY